MQRFSANDGAELAYDERGSGDARLLFVHGWQGDRSVWDRVTGALGSGTRAISVDLRGSGESKEAPGPYTVERFAEDLGELIVGLDFAPAVVIGHSMGAKIAVHLAAKSPELVAALVLLAPVPIGPAEFSEKGSAFLRSTVDDPAAARTWLSRMFDESGSDALEHACASGARASRAAMLESFDSWTGADFSDAAHAITVPTLVIAPDRDNPEMQNARVAALIPNARFTLLAGAGHYGQLERPAEVAELIRGFCHVSTSSP